MNYTAKSIKGTKSRENEDAYCLPEGNKVFELEINLEEKGYMFLLCDGMGGCRAGEVASNLCVNWFWKDYYEKEEKDDIKDWIKGEIDSLNSRLFNLAAENEEYKGMGTTIVGLLIKNNLAYSFNVGDSRCYIYVNNTLKQLTKDDSEVWRLYEKGFITKDEIINNKRKNIITAAIATNPKVNIHLNDPITLDKDTEFYLFSDGVHDVMTDSQIENIIKFEKPLEEKCDELITTALANKSRDDITIVAIQT